MITSLMQEECLAYLDYETRCVTTMAAHTALLSEPTIKEKNKQRHRSYLKQTNATITIKCTGKEEEEEEKQ